VSEEKSHEAASINGVFNSIHFQEILRCYLLFSLCSAVAFCVFSMMFGLSASLPFVAIPSAFGVFSFVYRGNILKREI
jgi:hypothetical protein